MRLITSFFNSKSRAIGRLLKIFILNKVEHLFLPVNAQPFSFFKPKRNFFSKTTNREIIIFLVRPNFL